MCKTTCSCGPNWLWKKVRCLLSKRFEASCVKHDSDYEDPTKPRKQSDKEFFANMVKQSGVRPDWMFVALCYYAAVRVGGWLSKRPRWMVRNKG